MKSLVRFFCLTLSVVLILSITACSKKVGFPEKEMPESFRVYEVRDDKPASHWEHAYPVGNGRLGAMPFGSYPHEQILLNDETIWQGRNSPQNRSDLMFTIEDVRKLLWQNKYKEAQNMVNRELLVPRVSPRSFQPMGFLHINYNTSKKEVTAKKYDRALSMNDALATSEIVLSDGNIIKQEVFSSHPDGVIVINISSKTKGGLSFSVDMDRYASFETTTKGDNMLIMEGMAQDEKAKGTVRKNRGTRYCAIAKIYNKGGEIFSEDNRLNIEKANSVTILITSSTDYNYGNALIPLRHNRLEECLKKISSLDNFNYKKLKSEHIADHQAFFNRATLDLGASSKETLKKTTPERIKIFNAGGEDPDLLEDLFQMGRYMLIASSREGTLPANLTGIWNGNPDPACHSDWHTNINVQQNYWHAELTNLSELHEPFINMINDCRKGRGQQLAEKMGCRGFLMTHATHAWEEAAFSGHSWWGMWTTGGAWSVSHVMEHYRFSQNKDYLKNTAYPILKDNVLFLLDWLVEHPETGKLVSGPSTSPENGFYIDNTDKYIVNVCMGPTIDHMISYESFTDFLEASEVLGIEDELTKQIRDARGEITKTKIASDGRLMEWDKEYKEWKVNHRHYSHLYALHPGCEITEDETPELFEAARKSIAARQINGGVWQGWSRAHLLNLYARLGEGKDAYKTIQYLMKNNTLPNLMHTQSPIFFDGNGAGTAGFIEMLVHSHGADNIHTFLPALPTVWLNGSFAGICTRGGFEIDFEWKDGKPVRAKIYSKAGNTFKVEADSPISVVCDGKKVKTNETEKYHYFTTNSGESYTIEF